MMSPELIESYQRELSYLREQGGRFAQEHPSIAEKLGLSEKECQDPYVERLLEGVAFLTAKLNLKVDAEFPKFTHHLLEVIAPELLAPIPSMAIFQFQPDFKDGSLLLGPDIPRQTPVRSPLPQGGQTACEFRTCQGLRVWPIQVDDVQYSPDVRRLRSRSAKGDQLKSSLLIQLKTTNGLPWQSLALDELVFYLDLQNPLLDECLRWVFHDKTVLQAYDPGAQRILTAPARTAGGRSSYHHAPESLSVELCGFDEHESLLPHRPGFFSGYRILLEYFRFPERFQFIRLKGLAPLISSVVGDTLHIAMGFTDYKEALEDLRVNHVCLNAVPAINLFEKPCDHITLRPRDNEHHLIVDRSCQFDYEVHTLLSVQGYKADQAQPHAIAPYHDTLGGLTPPNQPAYSVSRVPLKRESPRQPEDNTGYVGTDVYLQLNDVNEQSPVDELAYQRIGVTALCTNRDLPYQLRKYNKDFRVIRNEPVEAQIVCKVGPTKPRRPLAHRPFTDRRGKTYESPSAWQAVAFLSQNFVGLRPSQNDTALQQIKRLLSLYAAKENGTAKLVDGLLGFRTERVSRLDNSVFPPCLERGIHAELCLDEECFRGFSPLLFSKVLSYLLAHFAELNTFVELTVTSPQRERIAQWPMRPGKRGMIL